MRALCLVLLMLPFFCQAQNGFVDSATLPEVLVPNCEHWKNVRLYNGRRQRNSSFGYSASLFHSQYSRDVWVGNPAGKPGRLLALTFYVADLDDNQHNETPVKLHFYLPGDSGRTGPLLINDDIRVIPGRTGAIYCDLSNYRIPMPAQGIMIGIELLDEGSKYWYESKSKDYLGKPKTDTFYGFFFNVATQPAKAVDPQRPWAARKHRWTPAVGLDVRFCAD
jgi:hypothetical protein